MKKIYINLIGEKREEWRVIAGVLVGGTRRR